MSEEERMFASRRIAEGERKRKERRRNETKRMADKVGRFDGKSQARK